jgi:hypothetical protein
MRSEVFRAHHQVVQVVRAQRRRADDVGHLAVQLQLPPAFS